MTTKGVLRHGWWLENPDLGAPFGQELYDFPNLVGHSFNLLLIKLLGVFSSAPALITNLFFLLSFPLVALASFLVLRQIGISGGASLVCSVLYALAPYHFLRGEHHLHLAAYYSVPVGAYLVLSLLSGRQLFARRGRTGPRLLAWASKRSVLTLALCLFIALAGGPYYAVFTGLLLIAAAVLMLVIQRDVRALVQGSALLVAIFGFLMLDGLPSLVYMFANEPNNAIDRGRLTSELYSLEFVRMVIPAPGHQVDALSDLAEKYYESTIIPGGTEGPSQSLGFITTLGFAWLLLVALVGCLSPRWMIGDPRHRQLATATVIAFLIGTTGGISVLFTALVSQQIRSWARISILIAFFAIAAVGLLIDALGERTRVRRGHPVLFGVLLLSVLLIGLYDQANNSFVPDYSAVKAEYQSDAVFVGAIDHELPPQARVFQLPYESFPEPEEPAEGVEMTFYSHLSPYVHESDLRWSYGAVKGRPNAAWQADLADKPAEDLVDTITEKGFDGIYVDRFGYPDRGVKLEGELGELLTVEPVVSPDERKSFFSLLPYKERLQSRTPL
jgi:phosphoglycerol transferase